MKLLIGMLSEGGSLRKEYCEEKENRIFTSYSFYLSCPNLEVVTII